MRYVPTKEDLAGIIVFFILLVGLFGYPFLMFKTVQIQNDLKTVLYNIDSMRVASAETTLAQINAMKAEQLSRMYQQEWKPVQNKIQQAEQKIYEAYKKRRK